MCKWLAGLVLKDDGSLRESAFPLVQEWLQESSTTDENGCWIWNGTLSRGYGMVYIPQRNSNTSAHRLAWEVFNGASIPDGLFVCHVCDVTQCINPAHLWLGTAFDNARDREKKGRGNRQPPPRRSHCKQGHALSVDNLYIWGSHRQCRTCRHNLSVLVSARRKVLRQTRKVS